MLRKYTMKASAKLSLALVAVLAFAGVGLARSPEPPTQLEEIYRLIRTNLAGLDLEQFEKEAIRALLRRTNGDAELVRRKNPKVPLTESSRLFEKNYGYVRVRNVEAGLAEAIRSDYEALHPTGGLMLDLRFATGRDYAAAVSAANQFLDEDRTQLVVGEQHLRTRSMSNIITGPVTVLVNRETSGAAEALAALLRRKQVGLLIGTRTAARAKVFSEFELRSGGRLRVATGEVKFDDGQAVAREGLKPDIAVEVEPEEERYYFSDAYAAPKGRKALKHLNEAQLVRQLELRLNPNAKPDKAAEIPVDREVFDPVLARALDLLKGLRTLGEGR